ncbi:DNA alkylation repair protein [Prevotellaceae bacterium LCP21S3_C11]|uniref:DNA alkylation repair protein n=1 Tax=Segatella hominis TaxID=2518605 RepID=UPI001F3FB6B4|nr:DNA alkylation repair protein [Segatella hominis]MBS7283753.1 DNA alkylation repair protein [Prevotella sp.]MCF2591484.1 DNA alkylation repair protein [Segatella hominis]
MNEETHQKLMKIKRSFRLLMSGPTSQSMTQKGLGYKINWGVPFIELKKMALEYGKDYELAIELWKEDIRECKILATLIMPAEKMLPEITDIWMEQVKSQEMAEMLAFNLLQYVDYAPAIAYEWIATDKTLYEIAGFQLLARLFANGQEANERGINEFLDQATVALQGDNMGIKHAAANCVLRFADLGEEYEKIARAALKGIFEL